jgi:hypothetical protein
MAAGLTAGQALDRYYLEMRCKMIEVAASLDRIERGEGFDGCAQDPRMALLGRAICVLGTSGIDRARRIQEIFSLPYDSRWRETFGL